MGAGRSCAGDIRWGAGSSDEGGPIGAEAAALQLLCLPVSKKRTASTGPQKGNYRPQALEGLLQQNVSPARVVSSPGFFVCPPKELRYPILSYPVLSCPILSYPVLSCPILSYPILLCCPTRTRKRRPPPARSPAAHEEQNHVYTRKKILRPSCPVLLTPHNTRTDSLMGGRFFSLTILFFFKMVFSFQPNSIKLKL